VTTNQNKRETILAHLDGRKYFFIHHMANTDLGQLLSPLTFAPFTHPIYGNFKSVIGFSYWLQCGKNEKVDFLRKSYGTDALRVGTKAKNDHGRFISSTETLREMTYAALLKIEDYQNNNSSLTVTIKHEMAGNNLPYVHVKNIRNNDSGGLYGKTTIARVRKLPEYNRLGEIYSAIGKLFRTSVGRSYTPEQIMQQLDKEGLFNRIANPDTVLID
jgi:hypothetical protein